MDVYFIRHGQSTSNADGTHCGWAPIPLTEAGREQAVRTHNLLKSIQFERLFVSDVFRAQQTADIIFPDMPRTMVAFAREINNTPMRGHTKDDMAAILGDKYLQCRVKYDYSPLGIDCESMAHLHSRSAEFLKYLESYSNLKRVAVVSHAGFISAIAANVLGMRAYPSSLMCENASVSVFRFNERGWHLRSWSITSDVLNPSD